MDLFKEILPSIFEKKSYLFDGNHDESKYNIFIVNKALSFHMETAPYAAYLANTPNMTKKQHYDFLYYSIPHGKRFIKWFKYEREPDLDYIKWYYECSENKAEEILNIITVNHLEEIKRMKDDSDERTI